MFPVPSETLIGFDRRLEGAAIPARERPDYRKWMRFYLDFCQKYGHPPGPSGASGSKDRGANSGGRSRRTGAGSGGLRGSSGSARWRWRAEAEVKGLLSDLATRSRATARAGLDRLRRLPPLARL